MRFSLQELGSGGSGYLVGDSCSLADVGLLELVLAVQDYYLPEELAQYQHVQVSSPHVDCGF